MGSLTQENAQAQLPPPYYFIPLSSTERGAINDLLALGCRLYYQRGKERIYADPQVLPAHVIPENRALTAPCHCDSLGIDVGSLPVGVSIIDLDNPCFAAPTKEIIDGESGDH